jgi:thiosulfate reductase cytochrome b subunit
MQIVTKHSLVLRIFHWINVPVLLLMIWSGILIYWANPAYLKIPLWLENGANLHHRLAEGMGWHFLFMWIFFINGFGFIIYTFSTHHWRELIPGKTDLKNLMPFILSDLHLSKRKFEINEKFNPAQKVAYTSMVIMGIGTIVTGLAIYKPVQLGWLTWMCGGYTCARFIHFLLMAGISSFIVIHLLQVARSGWNNFRSMITGFEIEKD